MHKVKRWEALIDWLPKGCPLIGAEIGVEKGKTSCQLLKNSPKLVLHMIDPWCVPPPDSSYAKENDTNAQKSAEEHEAHYKKALRSVAFAGKRAVIHREYSETVAKTVPDKSLDFVFIDGDHSYEGVSKDIQLWLPKIKPGGFLSGHDYFHPKLPGVKKAVDEVFKSVKLDVNRTWFVRVK